MKTVLDAPLSRRRSIAIGGGLLAAGATGLALGTERAGAQASITMGSLGIEDGEIETEDGTVYAPYILIDNGEFNYSVNTQPAAWDVYLLAENPSNGDTEAIGITSGQATATETTETYQVRGPVTAASFWDADDDFSVTAEQGSVDVTVPVQATLVVYDSSDNPLIQDTATGSTTVTVTYAGAVAAVGGTGFVAGQDDQEDPTPSFDGGA